MVMILYVCQLLVSMLFRYCNAISSGVCVQTVDDFRSVSAQMLDEHFKDHCDDGRVGRVEYLPVRWHSALHGDATGIDRYQHVISLIMTL